MGAYASFVQKFKKNRKNEEDDEFEDKFFSMKVKDLCKDLFDEKNVADIPAVIIRPERGETEESMVRTLYAEYIETLRSVEGYKVPDSREIFDEDVNENSGNVCNDYFSVVRSIQEQTEKMNEFRVSTPRLDVPKFSKK